MSNTYKFENSISEEMPLPSNSDSIMALNLCYVALARTLEKQSPGFSHELLSTIDKVYEQNEGRPIQLAIAQLAAIVKYVTSGKE